MKIYLWFIILVLTILMYSCEKHSSEWHTLNDAEAIMEERPDSSLNILRHIDESNLSDGEELARYALLVTMANDKNYIDTKDDSVINIAYRYYEDKNKDREKCSLHSTEQE